MLTTKELKTQKETIIKLSRKGLKNIL